MPVHKPHSTVGIDQSMPTPLDLPDDDRRILKAGVAAYNQIAKGLHREQWLQIGRSLNALQHAAMVASGSNAPIGIRYNEYRSYFAHKEKMTAMLTGVHPPEQSNAMWLAREWRTIEAWLGKKSDADRTKLNNPTTIKRHFAADSMTAEDKARRADKDTVHKRLARIEDERDFYKTERNAFAAEIKELHEIVGHIIPPNMPPAEAALRVRNEMDPDWVLEFRAALADEPWHDERLDDHPMPLS